MTLRIDRVGERIRLSGDLRFEHLHQVQAEMDQCGSRSVLDLEEADRVDVEAVHFLNSCEARGVPVLNASAYIRAWMTQEEEQLNQERKVQMKTTKPSIVFCHGIWADGSSFGKVIPPLQADGYEVMAAQYGLDTPEGDVATVKQTLGRVSGPTILVGHSYGGSVITAAGTDDRVVGLVYIAALAPDADETSQAQQAKYPVTDVFSFVEVADGRVWMLPKGVECFAGDLSEEDKKVVWATHYAPDADLFNQKVPGAAWRSKPSWYIVA